MDNDERDKRIFATYERHRDAEVERDIEAVMDTIAPNAFWEYFPLNIRITGPALREHYVRILANCMPNVRVGEHMTRAFGDARLVTEKNHRAVTADGTLVPFRFLTVVETDAELEKYVSERVYMDRVGAEFMTSWLGTDLFDMPGVERI